MRPAVFLWENFGPYHLDRLRAVAAGGRPVIGIEFTRTSNTYHWESDRAELDIRTLAPTATVHRPIARWRLAARLLHECWRIGRADWFLCHYHSPVVFLAASALRLLGRRVFTMVDSKFDDYPRSLLREIGKAALLLPYRGALTASPRSRDYLRFLGIRADRMAFGYDTMSIARIAALSGAPPAPDGTAFAARDWVVVARFVPKKNVALAIEAFALWLAQTPHPRDLHLCGAGPLEDELRALASRLGVAPRVHFHGFVQSEAVARRLARALALLLPSVEEQFGLVVIEAQACGVPVLVSSNVGAGDVLIDAGLNGFVLPPRLPASWASSMLLLSEDEARWRRFAAAARDGADRGDVARFREGVAALLGASAGRQMEQPRPGHAPIEREDRAIS